MGVKQTLRGVPTEKPRDFADVSTRHKDASCLMREQKLYIRTPYSFCLDHKPSGPLGRLSNFLGSTLDTRLTRNWKKDTGVSTLNFAAGLACFIEQAAVANYILLVFSLSGMYCM